MVAAALNRSRAASLALLVAGLGAAPASASPWLPAPGHFYLELRETFDTTAQGFDAAGTRHTLGVLDENGGVAATRLYDAQTRLYAEVGLATRLAVLARFTMLHAVALPRAGEPSSGAVGVGDLDAGFRLQLLDEEVTCALEATLGIPTGPSGGRQPLGTGDLRGQALLSIGHVGQRRPFYVVLDLGAQLRSSGHQSALASGQLGGLAPGVPLNGATVTLDYASELVYALELGYIARLGERTRLFSHVSLDGRYGLRAPAVLLIDPISPVSTRFVRLGAGLGLEVTPRRRPRDGVPLRLLIQGGGGAFVWGEGLPAAGDLSLALGLSR